MVGTPPGHKPPGWKRPSGMGYERQERQAHAVGGFFKGINDAKETKRAKRKSFLEHRVNFRSDDGRLRAGTGIFVKDPTPNHKRVPPIVPWNKGKKLKKEELS